MSTLTPEQEAKLYEYRRKHYAKATEWAPVDVKEVAECINRDYEIRGYKPPPEGVIVTPSPKAAMEYLTKRQSLFDSGTLVSEANREGIREVTDSNGTIMSKEDIQDMVDAVDLEAIGGLKEYHNYVLGMPDVHWMSFYIFCEEVMGEEYQPEHAERLRLHERLVNQVCYWYPYEEFCLVVERPQVLMYSDLDDYLHNEHGPSVAWSDGYSWYHFRGVRVPSRWITDKNSITIDDCLKHPNLEERAAACAIKGWANVLKEVPYKVLDKDNDPQIGALLEVDLPDLGKENFLFVRCATWTKNDGSQDGRYFAMPVAKEDDNGKRITTALQANAWTYGMDGDLLKQRGMRT